MNCKKISIRGDLFMKGKHIPALAVLCCALSLTAPVWAAPAADGLDPTAVTATAAATAAQSSIRDVTALSTVFGDGESVSAVALHYPKTIDASRLKASDFTVAGKTIDKVYTNDAPETALPARRAVTSSSAWSIRLRPCRRQLPRTSPKMTRAIRAKKAPTP